VDQLAAKSDTLPPLPLEEWEPTRDTVHLWCQIIGKTRLAVMPMRNHWWNVALYPSTRGITTRRLPVAVDSLEIELDLVDHRLRACTRESEAEFRLHDGLSVADFYRGFADVLADLGIRVEIRATPYRVPMTTPFAIDREHASYDPAAVARFHQVLLWSADVLEQFAGWYAGKTSPVHLFWHGFDLACSRFSGARAPVAPGVDAVTAEAYSHETISFGFWAGDRTNPFPAYYSYTVPEPTALTSQLLRPDGATWTTQPTGSLAVLPYADVTSAVNPRQTLLEFFQSAFEAGASLAGWNLADTATSWGPVPPDRLAQLDKPTSSESTGDHR
jgi:hypothetical protein